MNYNGKIDLLKLQGASINELNYSTGVKKCIVIPIYDAGLVEGKKGVYLDFKIYKREAESYGETHTIKQSVGGERYKYMSEDERNAIPFLGGLKPISQRYTEADSPSSEPAPQQIGDLPL